jgi:hypothetical protein
MKPPKRDNIHLWRPAFEANPPWDETAFQQNVGPVRQIPHPKMGSREKVEIALDDLSRVQKELNREWKVNFRITLLKINVELNPTISKLNENKFRLMRCYTSKCMNMNVSIKWVQFFFL